MLVSFKCELFRAFHLTLSFFSLGRMGIEILSFTIKDVYDDVQYLQSLGKAQTASVKRDADSGVAEANRSVSLFKIEQAELITDAVLKGCGNS